MAKLIDLRNAGIGTTLYEECDFGIGTAPVIVEKKEGRGAILREGDGEPYFVPWNEKMLRYWDSEPTVEEREQTAWVYSKRKTVKANDA